MSYIFEALKRLEQKRQGQATSRLLMVTGEIAPNRRRRPIWAFSLVAALLLLNAAVIIWLLGPWAPEKQSAQRTPAALQTAEIPAVETTPPPKAKEQDRSENIKAAGQKHGPEQKTAGRAAAQTAVKGSDISQTKRPSVVGPANAESHTLPENRASSDRRALTISELPPAIRSALPVFKISAHYYTTEPQARFTKINEQTLREGQTLTPDLKLEEITPDSVVLSYQGRRFRIGINGS